MKIICHGGRKKKKDTMWLPLLLKKIKEQSNFQDWQLSVK